MINGRYLNWLTGDKVTVVGVLKIPDITDHDEQITYRKDRPIIVEGRIKSVFSKPAYVFNKTHTRI